MTALIPTLIQHAESLGYEVTAHIGVNVEMTATKDGETFVVRADRVEDADLAACRLLEMIGVELDDG